MTGEREPANGGSAAPPGAPPDGRAMLRSATAFSLLTLGSRVLGLVREQLRALYLGTGASSDAFGLALMLPNLFRRLLGEGQMTAAMLPTLVERLRAGDRDEARRFFADFLGVFVIVVTAVVAAGFLATPAIIETFFSSRFSEIPGKVELTIQLTQALFPFLGLITFAAMLQAGLQANHLFWPGALGPVLLNVVVIGAAVLLQDLFPDPAFAFAAGYLGGAAVQLLFQVPFLWRVGLGVRLRFGFSNPYVRRVLRLFLPGILAGGVYQIDVFVAQMVASSLDQGRVAALQFSVRLQELVLGVFVVSAATVILPTLSANMADEGNASAAAKRTLSRTLGALSLVTLPAAAGLVVLGPVIVRLLFRFGEFDEASAQLVVTALQWHALGIIPIALSRNVVQAFYAQKDLTTPTIIAACTMVVHLGLCLVLSGPLDHGGIALAGAISSALTVALQIPLLHRRGVPVVDRTLLSGLARAALATAVMAWVVAQVAAATGALSVDADRLEMLGGLLCCLAAAGVVYAPSLLLLRHPDALALVRWARRRGR